MREGWGVGMEGTAGWIGKEMPRVSRLTSFWVPGPGLAGEEEDKFGRVK